MVKRRSQRGEGTVTQRLAIAGSWSHPKQVDCRGKRCYQSPELKLPDRAGSTEHKVACWSWWLPGDIALPKMPPWAGRGKDKPLSFFLPFTYKPFSPHWLILPGSQFPNIQSPNIQARAGEMQKWIWEQSHMINADVVRCAVKAGTCITVSLPIHYPPSPASLVHSGHTVSLVFLKYCFYLCTMTLTSCHTKPEPFRTFWIWTVTPNSDPDLVHMCPGPILCWRAGRGNGKVVMIDHLLGNRH